MKNNYPNETIEQLLYNFKNEIGKDYDKYKNHVYRVFLNCMLMDDEKSNKDKYAIASVFHDIGIWTDHTIDYLSPSIKQVKNYLQSTGRQNWLEEISLMIYWHHKINNYTGVYKHTVEIFRKADWIDVSLGIFIYGNDKQKIKTIKSLLPGQGFHLFLIKKIILNFLRHPLHPLPMFTR